MQLDRQTLGAATPRSHWLGDTNHQVIALRGRIYLGGDSVVAEGHECTCLSELQQQV